MGTTVAQALLKHVRDSTRYDLQNFWSHLDFFFTHDDDVSEVNFVPRIRGSEYVVISFEFMDDIICRAVEPARPNIWKAEMKAINSSVSAENQKEDSCAPVTEIKTDFRQLYNHVSEPFISCIVPKKRKCAYP